jgi:adenine specific DNA methylase Mod
LIEKVYKNLDKKSDDIPILWIDNIIAKELASIYKSHAKTKYIEVREMFIKDDIVSRKRLKIKYTPGTE